MFELGHGFHYGNDISISGTGVQGSCEFIRVFEPLAVNLDFRILAAHFLLNHGKESSFLILIGSGIKVSHADV